MRVRNTPHSAFAVMTLVLSDPLKTVIWDARATQVLRVEVGGPIASIKCIDGQ